MSRWLAARFLAERDRWALWLPVLSGMGVALHFASAVEPPPWSGVAALLVVAALGFALRGRPLALIVVIGLGALVLGGAAAQWRNALVAAPILERETRTITVAGRVAQAEPLARGQRVVLEAVTLPPGHARPERVRLRLTSGSAPA
ncbi:MAG: ComEC family competence protein, partial [Alphaproteobacteria bacterium]|nr:ComEC family competence protein [Alphaproteobacteria bacterium]